MSIHEDYGFQISKYLNNLDHLEALSILVLSNNTLSLQPHVELAPLSVYRHIQGQKDLIVLDASDDKVDFIKFFDFSIDALKSQGRLVCVFDASQREKIDDVMTLAARFKFKCLEEKIGELEGIWLFYLKQDLPDLRLKLIHEEHVDDMLKLFKDVFGHAMSKSLWQWKYRSPWSKSLSVYRHSQLIDIPPACPGKCDILVKQ